MKKTIFWFLLLITCIAAVWWLTDVLITSKKEYSQFRGAAHTRELYAQKGGAVGLAAAGDWSTYPFLLNGIELAVEEINESGGLLGRAIKLMPVNDKGSLAGALEATQQICEQPETLFVVGHTGARMTQAVVQNYEFYGLLMISPLSANLTQSQKNFQFIFSNSTRLEMIAGRFIELARENHWSKIGLTFNSSDINTRQAHYFESILMSCNMKTPQLLGVSPEQGSEYLKTQIENQLKNYQIDCLIVVAGIQESLEIIRIYRASGFTQPIVLKQRPQNHICTANQNLLTNVYWPSHTNPEASGYNEFSQAYFKKFGIFADTSAISGYDTVMILAEAVKKSQSLEAVKIAKTLKLFQPDHSLTGTLGFDENGNAVKAPFSFGQLSLKEKP